MWTFDEGHDTLRILIVSNPYFAFIIFIIYAISLMTTYMPLQLPQTKSFLHFHQVHPHACLLQLRQH